MAGTLLFILQYKTHSDLFIYAREIIQIYRSQEFLSFNIHWPFSLSFLCLFEPWHFMWREPPHPIVFEDKISVISLCHPIKKIKKSESARLGHYENNLSVYWNNSYVLSHERTKQRRGKVNSDFWFSSAVW